MEIADIERRVAKLTMELNAAMKQRDTLTALAQPTTTLAQPTRGGGGKPWFGSGGAAAAAQSRAAASSSSDMAQHLMSLPVGTPISISAASAMRPKPAEHAKLDVRVRLEDWGGSTYDGRRRTLRTGP